MMDIEDYRDSDDFYKVPRGQEERNFNNRELLDVLEQTNFYCGLTDAQKRTFASIYEEDQVAKIQKIDLKKGY